MKLRLAARALIAMILGLALGVFVYCSDVAENKEGRAHFLGRKAAMWDRFASGIDPAWHYLLMGLAIAIVIAVIYELLAVGMETFLKKVGANRAA